MITSISSINTAKTNQFIAPKHNTASSGVSYANRNSLMPSFKGYLYNLVKNTMEEPDSIYPLRKQEEEEIQKALFLSEDAALQYSDAMELAQSIKDEIRSSNVLGQNNEPYRKRLMDNGKKSIVTADYSSNKNGISINKIEKLYINGSYDSIEFDKEGRPSTISNGVVNVLGEGKLISERYLFNNGLLNKIQLGIKISGNKSYVAKEVTLDNGIISKILNQFGKKNALSVSF